MSALRRLPTAPAVTVATPQAGDEVTIRRDVGFFRGVMAVAAGKDVDADAFGDFSIHTHAGRRFPYPATPAALFVTDGNLRTTAAQHDCWM